ncbi:xylose isomerase-like protein [Phlyctochytrium arcticum]|nr:xylose isomerase-like protein [Phlyctochytrium arcticum]
MPGTSEYSALVGYTGLVGSNLRLQRTFTDLYNSKNVTDLKDTSYDVVYFAACPAEKWKINQQPEQDLATLTGLRDIVKTIKPKLFVLISTIDVYNLNVEDQDESTDLSASIKGHHAYGKHRFWFEQWIRELFPNNHLIVRLPALHGPSLKKNYIYDLLNDNNPQTIKRNSYFQWYDLTRLEADIRRAIELKLTLVNLFPEPVWTNDILSVAEETKAVPQSVLAKVPPSDPSVPAITYRIGTRYAADYKSPAGKYIYSASETLDRIRRFFKQHVMRTKCVVSNIAWTWSDDAENDKVLRFLRQNHVQQLELGPTKIWGSWDACKQALRDGEAERFGRELFAKGFTVPSFQAILFNCPQCLLLESETGRNAYIQHMKFVIDLCSTIHKAASGPSTRPAAIVMGAPKNRLRYGKSDAECDSLADPVWKELGAYSTDHNVVLCLEANPKDYGCDYLYNASQAAAAVRRVNHPGFRLHVDLACMTLAGDQIAEIVRENKDIIYHVHISEPYLEDFATPKCDHAMFARTLQEQLWESPVKISLEMKNGDDNPARVKTAVELVGSRYFDV